MIVAVTGSSGYFAPYVIRELLTHEHTVIGIDIREPREATGYEYRRADVTVLSEIREALSGADAVIHLAGIPHPLESPADDVYRANALGNFATAWAAGELGITRFILGSSESVLGTAFHPDSLTPDYLPIDERHPTLPLDPYGISKVAAEAAVERCAVRWGFSAATLRMPWIWGAGDPERLALYRDLAANYHNWRKNLWAFVDARDAATAFRLALTARFPERSLEPYYIVASQTWVAPHRTSRSLIDEFYQGIHTNSEPDEYASLISNIKAKAELGWRPEYKAADILQ